MLEGRVAWVFQEANFDVDRIIGFAALRQHDAEKMRSALMADFDPDFASQVQPGDLLVGASNFGFGHPHAPPMMLMRQLGVAGVIAASFAPLYRMGETAAGFPQVECPGICEAVSRWDRLRIDPDEGRLWNLTTGASLTIKSESEHDRRLIKAGGLFAWLEELRTPH